MGLRFLLGGVIFMLVGVGIVAGGYGQGEFNAQLALIIGALTFFVGLVLTIMSVLLRRGSQGASEIPPKKHRD